MKTLITALFIVGSITSHAQWVPMQYGQPFPFRVGIALSKETADSTKQFVKKLTSDYLRELKAQNELALENEFLKSQVQYKTQGYEGLQAQVAQLQAKNAKVIKSRKRRVWMAIGLSIVGTSIGIKAMQ